MGFEMILIGEGITKEDFSGYDDMVINGTTAVVSFKNSTSQHIFYQNVCKQKKYEILTFQDFEEIINKKAIEYEDYETFTFDDLIKWQFEGVENFIVYNDNVLSNWELDYDTTNRLSEVPLSGSVQVSNTGLFLANFYSKKLTLYVDKLDKIFTDFIFEEDITNLIFNSKDDHLLVFTKNKTYLFDILEGNIKKEFDNTNYLFDMTGENVLEINSNFKFNLKSLSLIKFEDDLKPSIMKTKYGQTMAFSDEKVQKILYFSENGSQKKTLANVLNVQFFFSKNRGFALITKSIKGGKSFTIESYSSDTITINTIENEIKKIEVSDNGFITYDIKKNVNMYKFDKYTFRMIKQVQKDDDVVISIYDNMYCIFDGETDNIEFYDNGKLRSVYSHQACTNIIWSESGLYCTSLSRSTGNTQFYNNNGKMFWKKIFNRITNFIWRPYYPLNKEEKENIKNYNLKEFEKPFEASAETASNLQELISEWKSFLIEKKQLISNL